MGIGQKIKDAITPGTHKHDTAEERADYAATAPGMGPGYQTGVTGTPGYGAVGTTGYEGENPTERATEQAAAEEAAATGEPAVAQTVTTAAAAPVGEKATGKEAVCGQEYFTKTEDRPIVSERVEYIKEHRPVEKEFVVETRATGIEREKTEGRDVEHLGTTERIVSEATPKGPCE